MTTPATIQALFTLAMVGGISSTGAAADKFAAVSITTTAVAPGIYALKGRGGNIGVLIGSDGVFVIDDQYAPLSGKILAAIATLSDGPIRFVFNTHWHGDHTGGNEAFGKTGAVVVAHDNVRQRMSRDQFDQFWKKTRAKAAPGALPMVTFRDRMMLHINGYQVEVRHIPRAHTDGDAVILFRRPGQEQPVVIHTGDIFFNGLYPFIDYSTGGHIDGVIAAAAALAKTAGPSTVIIPGHGPVCGVKELRAYHQMLDTVRGRVQRLIRAGKSLSDVLAAKPTHDFDAVWQPKGFIPPPKWVTSLYTMLAQPSPRATPVVP